GVAAPVLPPPPHPDHLRESDDLSHDAGRHLPRGPAPVPTVWPRRCERSRRSVRAGVRFVCIGDIHMAFRAIERAAPALRAADVAILTGDLTNFGEPDDAFRVVDAVRAHCPTVWAVTGNLDMLWVIEALQAAGLSLHGEGRRVGDLGVFGCGGSNITPMDTPTEFGEGELRDVLERGNAAVADPPPRLMICHTPPVRTPPR